MATPIYDAEYEAKKEKAKELIAAGGCYAIQFWSHTDAIRLCPKEHNRLETHLEARVYIADWISSAKKAMQLIQEGIDLLEK